MKTIILSFLTAISVNASAADPLTFGWKLNSFPIEVSTKIVKNTVWIRAGYMPENPEVQFRGNILYLEGLGDSMMNHQDFFNSLTKQGYRVISFDYMGQGGSTGFMSQTRLSGSDDVEIRLLAKNVWNRFARKDRPSRMVMGWSTGGLVAFQLANENWANAVVLIAPGLTPKLFVGDFFRITEDNLACVDYASGNNPHIDAVKPDDARDVLAFGLNLTRVAKQSEFYEISPSIPGLVFTAGEDKFVDSSAIPKHLMMSAPHFSVVEYPNSCHEIHNGINRSDLQKRSIDFFNAFTQAM